MKKIALVLSGCGHRDGSEITEAVSAILTLSQLGAKISYFAPNMDVEETDHNTGKPTGHKRNLITEAARISRGNVKDLKDLHAKDFDGLVFPGGMGAALNLSNFGQKGSQSKLNPEVARVISEFHKHSKPIAAICIAPALMALALGKNHVSITIGNDKETAGELQKLGAEHIECPVDDFITDRDNKVVTTPAYMYGSSKPHEIFTGIQKAIKEFYEMA